MKKTRTIRVLTAMLIMTLLLTSLPTTVFAAQTSDGGGTSTQSVMVPTTRHYWTYTKKDAGTGTSGGWKLFYEGEPATAAGETDTAATGVSYTHTYSGSFGVGVKDRVQGELGYSFGKTTEFSVSKTSRALKKGEYVKAYYMKNYKLTTIKQTEYKNVSGWKQSYPGGPYTYIDETSATGNEKTATAKQAILPKLKLEYFPSTAATSAAMAMQTNDFLEKPVYVEYYDYVDGQYILVDTEVRQ